MLELFVFDDDATAIGAFAAAFIFQGYKIVPVDKNKMLLTFKLYFLNLRNFIQVIGFIQVIHVFKSSVPNDSSFSIDVEDRATLSDFNVRSMHQLHQP